MRSISLLLCALSLYSTAYGHAGDLDSSFGTSGLVITDVNAILSSAGANEAHAVALQADGKIVTAGIVIEGKIEFALARYNTDGTLDTSFGTGGVVATDFSTLVGVPSDNTANAVAIQTNGKIVAAGVVTKSGKPAKKFFALARYNSDGSLDGSFGTGGLVITDLGAVLTSPGDNSVGTGVAIQTNGDIIVAGYSDAAGGNAAFALARYNGTTGTLDGSFGTSGLVLTNFSTTLSLVSGNIDQANAVLLQPDGKIIAVGNSNAGASNTHFALARYTTSGILDSTFGTHGLVLTNFGTTLSLGPTHDVINAVALQSDGKIIAAGYSNNLSSAFFGLARYNINGTLDTSFGTDGLVTTSFGEVLSLAGTFDSEATGVVVRTDGKIIAGGFSNANVNYEFALAQYNSDGTRDAGFGTSGLVLTSFNAVLSRPSANRDQAFGIALQPDNKIIAAGFYLNSSFNHNFGLARYIGSPTTSFISDSVICTACGPIALGKRGCMRSMIFNRGGKCVERAFGKFKQVESFDTSCQDILATFTVCDCAPILT